MEELCVQQTERNHLFSLPRLLNNRMLELRRQFLSRPKNKNREQVVNLQQNLFGSSEKKENLNFAQEELGKIYHADCQRWNFDIDSGKPTEGQYHWELLQETTQQALDTSGRLTCLTTFAVPTNSSASATSSMFLSSLSSPSTTKRAVTTTTFSTTTIPTAVISKKCVKRLQKPVVPNKVPKLITDYFKESKTVSTRCQSKDVAEDKDSVSNRMIEILKLRSMNVR